MAASLANVLTEDVVPGRPVRLRHDVDHVGELFRKLRARQLVVLGDPGAGKTVLALLSASTWDPRTEHLRTWLTSIRWW